MKYEWKVHITKQNHIRILISIRKKKKKKGKTENHNAKGNEVFVKTS